jgi:hypothetical protein
VVLFWPSKGEESAGGEEEQEEKARKGLEVEKDQEEKAKKEYRTSAGERGRRRRSTQERCKGEHQGAAAWP